MMRAGWEHFLASVLLAVMFPMLPLGIEWYHKGSVSEGSALIASVMYCASIAIFSGNLVVLGLGIISSIILSVLFGASLTPGADGSNNGTWIALASIIVFGVTHLVQRYDLHVVKGQNFISFRNAS